VGQARYRPPVAQRFLILHGFNGPSHGHWQIWLATRLRERGAWVSFPELPDSDDPSSAAWKSALADELTALANGEGERVAVCHSLGAVLWLRNAASVTVENRPDRALLVAPPSGPTGHAEINEFFPVLTDASSVAAAAGSTLLVCSDNDPYCPEGALSFYGEPLAIRTEVIPGGEHLNVDAGYGPWPHVEAWCLGLRQGVAW
jgi:predicted alpha/beta hydrolase family esterase